MSINPEVLALEQSLDTYLRGVTNKQISTIAGLWGSAWSSVVEELDAALLDLTSSARGGSLTPLQVSRSRRLQSALEATGRALESAIEQSGASISSDLADAVYRAVGSELAMIASQLPTTAATVATGSAVAAGTLSLVRADPGQIGAMINRASGRIASQTRPLSTAVEAMIRQELIRGVAVGENPRAVARRMIQRAEDRMNFGLSRALTISRTEMLDATRTAAQHVDRRNSAVVTGWTWVAHLDTRTCPACVSMHGQVFPLEEPGPFDHQNGRCARVPKTRSWADLGFPGIEESPDILPDADEWFSGLSDEEKLRFLGRSRYEAWSRGGFGRERWAVRQQNDGWRDSIRVARP